jgi:hypothetical protein
MQASSRWALQYFGAFVAALTIGQSAAYAQASTAMSLTTEIPVLAPGNWGWHIAQPTGPWFRGAVNRDGAGGTAAGVLYPTGHVLVALGAILAHAAINSAARDAEDKKLRENADKVLDPLKDVLTEVTAATLSQEIKPHLQSSALLQGHSSNESTSRWSVEMVPTFTLAQSARAWTLDVQVTVWSEPRASSPHAFRVVRVISDPLTAEQPIEYWRVDGGVHLKRVLAGLMAEALDMSLSDRSPQANATQKTVRFQDGQGERVERATVLAKSCRRVQFRSLREWLVSASHPSAKGLGDPDSVCLAKRNWFQ